MSEFLPIDSRPPAIALMGPTASGKTALAVEWVERFGMDIVSVDSALVYRGLNIGSAKPDADTRARAPHRLIDIRDPHETYSAAEFAEDALRELHAIHAHGRVPLLVGGTGLYFRALLQGLSDMPQADPALRAEIARDAAACGWTAMHEALCRIDPAAGARIKPGDAQRIQRALEVFRASGTPISQWQQAARSKPFPFRVLKLVVAPPDRSVLHERIARRFDLMIEAGLLDEVRRLASDVRLHADLPAMRAVGYRQALEHLQQGSSLAEFRDRGIFATRQLAKRQLTWLRGELDARWFDPACDGDEIERAVAQFLGR
ncbi:tRNA (adenosine(37)-N6)-dimethylallyltransferase MiaA [Xanthomonadaceae bacterium JHOS43]|nr:tRNA (adenosine(37)-N6)-dimethylallyltransferase MiaA [Xanthomonadaceae bacterium JHOS43]